MPDSISSTMNDSHAAIILTSLIIGCVILLGVGAALICSKCRRMLQKSRNTVAASPTELPKIDRICDPPFLYKNQSSGMVQCLVCQGAIHVGEMVRQLSICKHLFHANCISTWLHSSSTCPRCQRDIRAPDERIIGPCSSLEPA
ncbi:Ring-H2 zinc finger protein-like [Rhynchospora pubera]|uniref:RING-type E3 ubiquitin transferase n=1 Tax=Rhynchospora pubera TaxID=906938 RepID=A0AAV8GS11_9POAL|nr:Ring-H2 zinc finger protein-like [Rhynchospora pubera]KAJ4808423.1 Ring-H2 zinc finger protein-like [Rhynchospora pubera]